MTPTEGAAADPWQAGRAAVRAWPRDATTRGWLEEYADARAAGDPAAFDGSFGAFDGADLSGLDLGEALLHSADLGGTSLVGTELYRAALPGADLRGARCAGATLVKAEATGLRAPGADLRQADLFAAVLEEADLSRADLRGARLNSARLRAADLSRADLRGATLRDVRPGATPLRLQLARVAGCTFDDVEGEVAGPVDVGEETSLVLDADALAAWFAARGARLVVVPAVRSWPLDGAARAPLELWAQSRAGGADVRLAAAGARFEGADLSWADLSGASLAQADLTGVTLTGTNLSGADLDGARLAGASCVSASLAGATATGLRAPGADLRQGDLYGADLRGADLTGAVLAGAWLTAARLDGADLSGADLRSASLRAVRADGAPVRLTGARLGWCRAEGASGSVVGPVDVGEQEPELLAGDALAAWFAARSAAVTVVG